MFVTGHFYPRLDQFGGGILKARFFFKILNKHTEIDKLGKSEGISEKRQAFILAKKVGNYALRDTSAVTSVDFLDGLCGTRQVIDVEIPSSI